MLDHEYTRKLNMLWRAFGVGGVTDSLTIIEQITMLFLLRLADLTGLSSKSKILSHPEESLRQFWSQFLKFDDQKMLSVVQNEAFPNLHKKLETSNASIAHMSDVKLLIQDPEIFRNIVTIVNDLPFKNYISRGIVFNDIITRQTTVGLNGQFPTPRDIIRLIVEIIEPDLDESVLDPAMGTGGFLVEVMQYLLRENYSPSDQANALNPKTGWYKKKYAHDDYAQSEMEQIRGAGSFGYESDPTMFRIAFANMVLNCAESPNVFCLDTLKNYPEDTRPLKGPILRLTPKSFSSAEGTIDIVLTTPPFAGKVELEDLHPELLKMVKTDRVEILFILLAIRHLKDGGRSGIIIPDSILSGLSKAHVELRKLLLEKNQIQCIISLPDGIFSPYTNIPTSILIFKKGGCTDSIFYSDITSIDLSKDEIHLATMTNKHFNTNMWSYVKMAKRSDENHKIFLVSPDKIRKENYDLSIGLYKEHQYDSIEYKKPSQILKDVISLTEEISAELSDLKETIK